jgi:hypothetical protein
VRALTGDSVPLGQSAVMQRDTCRYAKQRNGLGRLGQFASLAGPVVMLSAAAPVLCVKLVLDTRVSMCDDAGDSGGPGRHEG